ncbi:uncharacterized protein GVI51_I08569 [Nakaseomyces glabratus]|uniref:Methionine--tRNA ligase, mitochondrial n=1 Tax=Candida glabrata (strain ATCC 2001 / BCRC 20586 / JCM 3761 / NBRC 0622 / NRRL Y-65 / CBS 138) TaxID=284593 RepID=Q6FQ68_CANGA|nr:uncharacterized protein CAGL0I08723g [Nakaseomyces glabratus]KAH7599887.1 tRNA synthetases class I (M) [Nakaseomyces glabratus]KAH7604719.1 tRNA synthetases class I (M) [Nakaseomyces glabratus]QHS67276.1 uncharacterized protein GVI51_I08569 [Nakaseomyces glabratus]CAG60563.1 unnamed protein product [Nakaseomyces glabratus]|eukprot:XP_447626.1 uncharacterized protein CAGL0I08723g [[Candida] glabrata]
MNGSILRTSRSLRPWLLPINTRLAHTTAVQSHVTTPIFYPNAKPHLGHLYSSLLCDIYHRWQVLNGDSAALFTTGTDEHGLKIQLAAEKNNCESPKAFVDKLYPEFVELDKTYDISYTRFIRTTDPDHIENVKLLWNLCLENGYIYKGKHEGWYSISDETFYPSSKVIKDPNNPNKYINTESLNEVIHQSEENYYFKLSSFKEKLINHITEFPDFVHPPSKRDQILRDLKNDPNITKDISISRPATRLQWGIEVPNDPSQKVYVWFDALCNYISSIGGIEAVKQNKRALSNHILGNSDITVYQPTNVWKDTVHVIGKDIEKFHIIFWPSFLLAANLPLPKQIVVHSHWLCNGFKMSKSLGNVVEPMKISSHYGTDMVRWFLMENSKVEEDGDFQEEKLFATTELFVSKWGNLINRCCGAKFNIERSVHKYARNSEEVLADFEKIYIDNDMIIQARSLIQDVDQLILNAGKYYEKFQYNLLIKDIWKIINSTNSLFQYAEPWKKLGEQQDIIIFLCADISRVLAILTQPIIPQLSHKLLDHLKVDQERRTIDYANIGHDQSYAVEANIKNRPVPIARVLGLIGIE